MRIKRLLPLLFVLVLAMGILASPAYAAPRPKKAVCTESSVVIDLADNAKLQLTASVLPEGAPQRVIWATKNKAVASVNSSGMVTAKKVGTTKIGVRPFGLRKITQISVKVVDSKRPTSLSVPDTRVSLNLGGTYTIQPTLLPADADHTVRYTSNKPSIAQVSASGVITAKKNGVAVVRVKSARNSSLSKTIQVRVAKTPTPSKIILLPDDKQMSLGDTLQLKATVNPSEASDSVSWTSSDKKVATVTNGGLVTALKEGTVKITVRSKAKSSVNTVRTIKVIDAKKPTAIKFTDDPILYFPKNSTYTLPYSVEPSSARKDATFKTTNSSIVAVDSNGKLTMKDTGLVTITITAAGTKLTDNIGICVLNTDRTTKLPAKYTTSDAASVIKENLALIDAVRESAYSELQTLVATGKISSATASLRKDVVMNAFTSAAFAWTTPSKVAYWNSSLSENNFRTDRVYYGMPYIQCGANQNYTNRQFTLAKAVTQQYFKTVNSSQRLFQMTSKRLNNYYAGCDCSSFVSMAIWGVNHAASYLNTTGIYKSSMYRTITGTANILPGDILVKSGVHTVMFLYYTDEAKTQMMLVENSSSNISCKVANISTYLAQGYVIKRPLKLG